MDGKVSAGIHRVRAMHIYKLQEKLSTELGTLHSKDNTFNPIDVGFLAFRKLPLC